MVSVLELRRRAVFELELVGNESPRADTDVLLSGILGFNKTDILLGTKLVDEESVRAFRAALERVKKGEPVQYTVGFCEFMSLRFSVNSDTLIPRADTEILVETVLDMCRDMTALNILDIGCGSGCIAVSLAYYMPESRVTSIDISRGALETAAKNAEANGVAGRTYFCECDIMRGFPQSSDSDLFDIIVSNPPYIPPEDIEKLAPKVRDFEPRRALDGGSDGLDFYRRIVSAAQLKKGGILAFEVGAGQAKNVSDIMRKRFENIKIHKDLSGIERVVTGIFSDI